MLAAVKRRIQGNSFLGVCVNAGSDQIHAMVLTTRPDGSWAVVRQMEGEALVLDFLKTHPCIPTGLAVYGPFILTSDLPDTAQASMLEVFAEEIPGATPDQFESSAHGQLLTLARKSDLQQAAPWIQSHQDQIITVALGPVNEMLLANWLHRQNGAMEVVVGAFCFSWDENEQLSFREIGAHQREDLHLEQQQIPAAWIPAWCAAMNAASGQIQAMGSHYELLRKELLFKTILTKWKMPVLLSLLAIFLCNTLGFLWLDAQHLELTEKSQAMQELGKKRVELLTYVQQYESMGAIRQPTPRLAWVCDQIGGSVPKGVALETMTLAPPSKDRKSTSRFLQEEVHLSGQATDAAVFNDWVGRLEKMSWIKSITHQQFVLSRQQGQESGEFQLILIRHVE